MGMGKFLALRGVLFIAHTLVIDGIPTKDSLVPDSGVVLSTEIVERYHFRTKYDDVLIHLRDPDRPDKAWNMELLYVGRENVALLTQGPVRALIDPDDRNRVW